MRVATIALGDQRSVGMLLAGDKVQPLDLGAEGARLGVLALVRSMAAGETPASLGDPLPLSAVALDAPIPRPFRNIFCVGKNYHEHAHEFARSGFDSSAAAGAVPTDPIIFSKVPESVVGPGDPIRFDPKVTTAVDYEVELAVIIGKGGRGISRALAMDHVWGYTIINDVTARDVQSRLKQWLVGKSFDSFCPMGPWAVTADEIDLGDTFVRTWVNGELRQEASTRDLIFDVPTIVETISAGVTLYPGDVIATGTPAGVGIGFDPPKYLRDGDVVTLEISGIGTLENRVEEIAA
ncbi:MAG: fumarylacetoacetate hydrolase family protein [Alphaproteobacteria bacterium]|nr:fumarylacetoacetate hydrolase family protein [Alphaproteobacteria bacterium]